MRPRKWSLMLLLPLAGCATSQMAPTADRITIAYRWPGTICAGVCPRFETVVTPDRQVTLTDLRTDSQEANFRATPSQAASFRAALAALRPAQDVRTHQTCPVPWRSVPGEDPRRFWMQVDEVSVTWERAGDKRELHACWSDLALKGAIDRALLKLLIHPWGSRTSLEGRARWLRCELPERESGVRPTGCH